MSAPTSRSWLRPVNPAASVALLCIPHAGAGAASFHRWLDAFPARVSPVPVQLPGREDAAAETPLRDVLAVVDGLLPQVRRSVDIPIALYGHSMGALVAFELAHALTAAGSAPVHLFVSGRRAPHLLASRRTVHALPDDEFVDALDEMGGIAPTARRSSSILRYTVRVSRADLQLCETYSYPGRPPLDCPVIGFYGADDPVVDASEIDAWSGHTSAEFDRHHFSGGHFFHQTHRAAIADIIGGSL